MITKTAKKGSQIEMVSLDMLVPEDHLLRKIDEHIDFSFIYDLVEEKYSLDNGRPSIDPVTLIMQSVLMGSEYPVMDTLHFLFQKFIPQFVTGRSLMLRLFLFA